MVHRRKALAATVLLMGSVVGACGPSAEPTASEPQWGVRRQPVLSTRIEPTWERTNQYFIAPVPSLTYYANDPASANWTWTTAAWNCASSNPAPGDRWFCTADMADSTTNTPRPGTHYWFRANVELHDLVGLQQLVLQDKYRPGRVLLNDGLVVFVNGKPQSWTPSVTLGKNYPNNVGMTLDSTVPTDWTFDAYSIPKTDLKEGQNEIAVLFEERHGVGGLGHLVLEARSNRVLYAESDWERTVEPFFEAFPYLTHYANDGRARAWTSAAWTGPAMNSDGHPIPNYVAGQTWFATADLAGTQPEPRPSTYFWFRTTLQIRELAQLQSLRMYDHSRVNDVDKRLCLNEGMIVFVNGVPLTDRMPNVSRGASNPLYGTGLTRDTASPSGWTFDAYSIPVSSLREGSNEIAVLFGECHGSGGICRPVLEATY